MKQMGDVETRFLECKLTQGEIDARAREVTDILGERDRLELERKAADKRAKAEIKELDAQVATLAEEARDGAQWRDVDCTWVRDDGREQMELVRDDTGAVVFRRPFLPDERQGRLFPVSEEVGS